MSSDPINPQHYKHLPVEAIDIIMAAIAKAPSNESAYLHGQVLKYLLRCWEKKGIEDLRKAKWYLDRMVNDFDDVSAEASGANETPSEDRPPTGWRKMIIGEDIKSNDKFWFCDNWIDFEKDDLPRGKLTSLHVTHIRKIETPNDKPDQDDHPHDFKVGDAVISWTGREGVIEAIGLIEGFPITVRHSIREQVSYKIGGVKKKHDDHPVEPTPWTPKIGDWVKVTKPVDCVPAHKIWWVKDMDQFDGKVMQITSVNPQPPWAALNNEAYDFDFAWLALAEDPRGQPAPKYRDPTQADLRDGPMKCEYRDNDDEQWRSGLLVYILSGVMPFLCTDKEEQLSGQWAQCRIEVTE